MNREEQLLAYLRDNCLGREYAILGRELAGKVGISLSRLQELVNRLRREGYPIGSSREGYFLIRTFGEAQMTFEQMDRMIRSLEAAKRGVQRGMAAIPLAWTGGDPHR